MYKKKQQTQTITRHAKLQQGKPGSSVKPDDSHSHKYYFHFLNRRETEITQTTCLTCSRGIFILHLQTQEGKKIPLIFISIISKTTKWEKKKWRILSCCSFSISALWKNESNRINQRFVSNHYSSPNTRGPEELML